MYKVPGQNVNQVIPFKSPLTKGDSGGCVFSRLFYNPLAPFPKGDFSSLMPYDPPKKNE